MLEEKVTLMYDVLDTIISFGIKKINWWSKTLLCLAASFDDFTYHLITNDEALAVLQKSQNNRQLFNDGEKLHGDLMILLQRINM